MKVFFVVIALAAVLGFIRLKSRSMRAGSVERFRFDTLLLYGYLASAVIFVPVFLRAGQGAFSSAATTNTILLLLAWFIGLALVLFIPKLQK